MKANLMLKIAVVTGGTDGIGLAIATHLAGLGAEVVIIGRNFRKGEAAVVSIKSATTNSRIHFMSYDLSIIEQQDVMIHKLSVEYKTIDILVHCAGVMLPTRELTREGFETVFALQYLARFHLSNSLLTLLPSNTGIIVNVSAAGTVPFTIDFENLNGEHSYNGLSALLQESVANDIFGIRFTEKNSTIRYFNYGPGYCRTKLFEHMPWWFHLLTTSLGWIVARSADSAAKEVMELILGKYPSGMYSRNLTVTEPNAYRSDPIIQDKLWIFSELMIDSAQATYSATMNT
jgi:NAD(P)-dependent dehydrogenase (short-subunit alcohol dehydrogenase family)